jgi:hypothetical protein
VLRRRIDVIAIGRRWLVLVGLAFVVLSPGKSQAAEVDVAATPAYERADAETVTRLVNEITSSPEFMPRKTFRQWLHEKLGRRDGPKPNLPKGVGAVIFWAVTIWCVLALVAILIHLAWTIWVGVRPARDQRAPAGGYGGADDITSPQELWSRSQGLARAGKFPEALAMLLLALLRRLETKKIVSFHKSKTNGEYVAEYPRDLPGRREFAQFVEAFERSIYGGLPVARRTYETMTSTAERIIHDASEDTEI